MNYIHFSAICTAAGHIWNHAHRNPRFRGHADVSERLQALSQRCLQPVQGLLADIGAQGIANVLWSSATLGFNPDDSVPGLTDALTSRFLYFTDMKWRSSAPMHRQLPMCCGHLQPWVIQQRQHRWWALSARTLDGLLKALLLSHGQALRRLPTCCGLWGHCSTHHPMILCWIGFLHTCGIYCAFVIRGFAPMHKELQTQCGPLLS